MPLRKTAERDKESGRHLGLSRNIIALSVLSLRKCAGNQDWITDSPSDSIANAALVAALRTPEGFRMRKECDSGRVRK